MNLLFCGGRELGVKILKYICENKEKYNVKVCGVCLISKKLDKEAFNKFSKIISKYNLKLIDIEEAFNMQIDIGFSINYNKLISENLINRCSKGFYNIHHSYNLRLKGRNISTHAILNSKKDNIFYHGTTLHKINKDLDAGGIVVSKSFDIKENDTAYTLFKRSDRVALSIFKEWFPRLLNQNIITYNPPNELIHTFKNADIPDKKINISELSSYEIYDLVRSFDFPKKEPAYFLINDIKIPLVIKARNKYQNKIIIKGITYYSDKMMEKINYE